jgi:hypothetical protein
MLKRPIKTVFTETHRPCILFTLLWTVQLKLTIIKAFRVALVKPHTFIMISGDRRQDVFNSDALDNLPAHIATILLYLYNLN